MSGRRRESGAVLAMVLIFVLLVFSMVTTFQHRAVLDYSIVRNRDAVAQAETLARGGMQLAMALLLEDRLRESQGGLAAETPFDVWARAEKIELPLPPDVQLRLAIEDAGARLNLNSLFEAGQPREGTSEVLLVELLKHALEQAELGDERDDDPRELARNLIDWIDRDDAALRGGLEDDPYQDQEPPYRAPNRQLLSLDELGLVEGFDPPVVEALRPFVTVYPYVDGEGINPNTAPPWVLRVLYHGSAGDYRFATADMADDVLRQRESGRVLCPEALSDAACLPIAETIPDEVFPPPSYTSNVFLVRSEARVGDVERTLEVAVDRADPTAPKILSWRTR